MTDLRQRLNDAFKASAYACDGECGLSEDDCRAPITWAGSAREGRDNEVVWIEGDTGAIAGVCAAVIAPELHRSSAAARECARNTDLLSELVRAVLLIAHKHGPVSAVRVLSERAADFDGLLDGLDLPAATPLAPAPSGLAPWDDGTCGDCATGKCHGTESDDCGCARHEVSQPDIDDEVWL
ncbi:hypothetical protein OIE13_22590 [Streptosporangium sp. NBC_01810]|uniref:hypothetical protein n=1 Tax=Streptosporangium sp. NBC_01810 TaxID=2975951 RepID=UPI002DD7F3A9|nr:hypothetical protein [Streptosporangium sp. NBC_01810]WSA23733.1 hypothetical protein OIE13_22590 [Streptosporangium sp. NBC_01810]